MQDLSAAFVAYGRRAHWGQGACLLHGYKKSPPIFDRESNRKREKVSR
jgi:hypothetical protein